MRGTDYVIKGVFPEAKKKESKEKGMELLGEALDYWEALSGMRRERIRCRDFAFGRQWGDFIKSKGKVMSEQEWIISQGGYPLQNNLVGRIVRHVVGLFRDRFSSQHHRLDSDAKERESANFMTELYARTMEEFLLSGIAIHRKQVGIREGCTGVWTRMVSPSSFFFNDDAGDPRGWDFRMIGEWHEVDFLSWCQHFVKNRHDYLKSLQLFPEGRGLRRVAEIWKREQRERLIVHDPTAGTLKYAEVGSRISKGCRSKWFLEDIWRFYFVSEDGMILASGDSPYSFGGHPYVVKCYPFADGEIHSFVSDIVDQQKYANRLITIYDWAIRASAKGVLLVPETAIDDSRMAEVADNWSRFDGIIRYRGKAGDPEPHQVSSTASYAGVAELLEIQLRMLEDVSGVTGTLQGNLSASSVSGKLYSQQTENALISMRDLLESFDCFIEECRRLEAAMDSDKAHH